MGLFKVVVRNGQREFVQVATEDELALRKPARPAAATPAPQEPAAPPVAAETTGSPPLLVLMEHLHQKGVGWAVPYVDELPSVAEVSQVRRKEVEHPKFPGGRMGVLTALDAREADLAPKKFVDPERFILSDADREALVMSDEDYEA